MLQLKYTSNPNGKLFAHVFGEILLAHHEVVRPGDDVEIWYRNEMLGIAEVIGASKEFSLIRLTDTMSHMNNGTGIAKQKLALNNRYKNLDNDSIMVHVVYKWKKPLMDIQGPLMLDWVNTRIEQYPLQQSLFTDNA